MTKFNKLDNTKEKLTGEIKEAAGKISNNEQLELKGKIQSSKADLKKKMSTQNNVHEIKESIAGKINNIIDKKEDK